MFSPNRGLLRAKRLPGVSLAAVNAALAFWLVSAAVVLSPWGEAWANQAALANAAPAIAATANAEANVEAEAAATTDATSGDGEAEGDAVEPRAPLPEGAVARLGEPRASLGSPGRALAFSPTANVLAIGQADGVVMLWNPRTDRPIARLGKMSSAVMAMAFSADGSKLAASESKNRVAIFDVAKRKRLHEIKTPMRSINALCFSPDGSLLAVGGHGSPNFSLVTVDTGRVARSWKVARANVTSAAFSPDGSTVVLAGIERAIRFYNPATGRESGKPLVVPAYPYRIAYAEDGSTIVVGLQDGQVLVFDPSAKRVGKLNNKGMAETLDKPVRTMLGHSRGVVAMELSRDGRRLLTRGQDATTRVWDMASGRAERVIQHGSNNVTHFNSAALDPSGQIVAAARRDALVDLVDADSGRRLASEGGHWGVVRKVIFSADGSLLASSADDGTVRVWSLPDGAQLRLLDGPTEGPSTLAMAGDQLFAVGADREAATLRVWTEGQAATVDRRMNLPGIRGLAISPEGGLIAAAALNGASRGVTVWESDSGRARFEFSMQLLYPLFVAFDGRGDRVAALGNGALFVWDTRSGSSVARKRVGSVNVQTGTVSMSPSGQMIAYCNGKEDRVRVLETGTLNEIAAIQPGGGASVERRIAFHPTSPNLLAVVGEGGTAELWNLTGPKRVKTFDGHSGQTSAVAISPDGRWLATGADDSTILIWPMPEQADAGGQTPTLSEAEFDGLWGELAATNAAQAFTAMHELAMTPEATVAFLARRLEPASIDRLHIGSLIEQLDDPSFDVREKATARLAKYGRVARPVLQRVLSGTPSPEARWRLEMLLEASTDRPVSDGAALRMMRAIRVLERINTPESRQVLERLAAGADEALLTEHARDALLRLQHGEAGGEEADGSLQ